MRIVQIIKEKYKNDFIKNSFTLFSGSLFSQIILFAFTPLLTHLYPEQIFGLFFVYSSISSVLRIITTLQIELSIVLPKKDSYAINLFFISMVINFILNLFIFILIFSFHGVFNHFLGKSNLGEWIYFIPLSSFLLGAFEIISYWNNRKESYKNISYAKISKAITSSGVQSIAKVTPLGNNGLIGGVIFGQFFSVIHIAYISSTSIFNNLKSISFKYSIVLLKKFRDIPLYNTIISGVNILSNQIPILLLAKYYGMESAAYYGIAQRIVATPIGLIAHSVGQIFFKKASDIINKKEDAFTFVKKVYFNLIKVITIPFLIIFGASYFFDFLFGSHWEMAGLYTRIILPWLYIAFLNNPISLIVTVLNKQKDVSFFGIILLILRISAIYFTYKLMGNDIIAVSIFSIVGLLFGVFMLLYYLRISKLTKNIY